MVIVSNITGPETKNQPIFLENNFLINKPADYTNQHNVDLMGHVKLSEPNCLSICYTATSAANGFGS